MKLNWLIEHPCADFAIWDLDLKAVAGLLVEILDVTVKLNAMRPVIDNLLDAREASTELSDPA